MVVFIEKAEVEPLHLRNGGGTVRARREERAGLPAHGHKAGVRRQVLLPSLLLSSRIGAHVGLAGQEAIIVMTDASRVAATIGLSRRQRTAIHLLLVGRIAKLDGARGRERVKERLEDLAPVVRIVEQVVR